MATKSWAWSLIILFGSLYVCYSLVEYLDYVRLRDQPEISISILDHAGTLSLRTQKEINGLLNEEFLSVSRDLLLSGTIMVSGAVGLLWKLER